MSGYRGRLIFPVLARIAPLDTAATAADPDADGELQSGYDEDFREPVRVPVPGEQLGVSARKEGTPIDIPVQLKDKAWAALEMMATGNVERSELVLICHMADLERLGLKDAGSGEVTCPRPRDRLVSFHQMDGTLIRVVPTLPGMFCREAAPRGTGLSGGTTNLLAVTFVSEDKSRRVG